MEPWLMRVALSTAEYIKGLPDKTRISLQQAIEQACPGQAIGLSSKELSDVYDAIEKVLRNTNVILDMSEYENMPECLQDELDFVVRKGRLLKARLTTNLVCDAQEPPVGTLVRQRLAITSEGQVFFSEALQGGKAGRRDRIKIGKDVAAAILSMFADLAETISGDADCGETAAWELALTVPGGIKKQLSGSGTAAVAVEGQDLSAYIRARVPIKEMALFEKL